ncbi:cyclopropane-fatty-acyl-phospholipid synthase family protein [Mycobacterium sp. pV006]|uniref:cyclopropane-fatty-acyl-phospholipid synthase family protein n=1 Tax=Mycobacterium sp. pV006 TaxID=3238983 RepID=UPI00351B2866
MSDDDRRHWDRRYADRGPAGLDEVGLPSPFRDFSDVFPRTGTGLDVACGRGGAAIWLAQRGLTVHGYDVSAVAVSQARELAQLAGCAERCHFEVVDLEAGLPPGPPAGVIVCSRFRDARLDDVLIARLAPDGLLAVSALSEVGANPGRYRAARGELTRAFARLEVLAAAEADGLAWVLARKPALAKISTWPRSR